MNLVITNNKLRNYNIIKNNLYFFLRHLNIFKVLKISTQKKACQHGQIEYIMKMFLNQKYKLTTIIFL